MEDHTEIILFAPLLGPTLIFRRNVTVSDKGYNENGEKQLAITVRFDLVFLREKQNDTNVVV